MLKTEQTLVTHESPYIQQLYNDFSDMLFGYILGIVSDHRTAEEQLVRIFSEISQEFDHESILELNGWSNILRYSKSKLSTFSRNDQSTTLNAILKRSETVKHSIYHHCLSHLNDEQKKIFCNCYYYGKTIDKIAIELNQPEVSIRKTLREAFNIIRTESGN